MAPIVSKIEIARPPNEVFSYVTDPSLFVEWQKGIVSGCMEGGAPPGVGSRCATTRRIGGAERTVTSEITEIRLPKSWAVHGVNAPIRAIVNVSVEPLNENTRSRLTIALDFEATGSASCSCHSSSADRREMRYPRT